LIPEETATPLLQYSSPTQQQQDGADQQPVVAPTSVPFLPYWLLFSGECHHNWAPTQGRQNVNWCGSAQLLMVISYRWSRRRTVSWLRRSDLLWVNDTVTWSTGSILFIPHNPQQVTTAQSATLQEQNSTGWQQYPG